MKFEYVKQVSEPVPSYGGQMVKTGDVVEIDGPLAAKAKANPDYRVCDESQETPVEMDDLRAQWEAKFGKAPHHKKSAKTLLEELNGDQG